MLLRHTFEHVGADTRRAASKGQILTLEFTFQLAEALDNDLLQFPALGELDGVGKVETAYVATSADAGGEEVLAIGIDLGGGDVVGVHVGNMLSIVTTKRFVEEKNRTRHGAF